MNHIPEDSERAEIRGHDRFRPSPARRPSPSSGDDGAPRPDPRDGWSREAPCRLPVAAAGQPDVRGAPAPARIGDLDGSGLDGSGLDGSGLEGVGGLDCAETVGGSAAGREARDAPALDSAAAPIEPRAGGARSAKTEKPDEKPRSGILEALALVCVAFALALTLKSYVAEAYEIKGRSMEPSFKTGQRVIVLKAFYAVQRSDVVVFASTEDAGKDLIKRVVGLPGDRIAWRDGRVFVNDEPLEEPYVKSPASVFDPPHEEETVPPGKFYVLGDNRPDSHDSRYFHSIPAGNVKGEVVLRWWPFEDFDFFLK